MSEPFLAEVRIVGFNFAPRGWAFCDGQILPINQNQSLYSLLGTMYGGDGRTNFALPDLRGRTPIHPGNGHSLGEKSGAETVTLTNAELPPHNHQLEGTTTPAATGDPTGALWADNQGNPYGDPTAGQTMAADTIANSGGGQAHDNMQPYQTLAFCIALQGLFPSRN